MHNTHNFMASVLPMTTCFVENYVTKCDKNLVVCPLLCVRYLFVTQIERILGKYDQKSENIYIFLKLFNF